MSLSGKVAISTRPVGQRGLFATADIVADEILITYDGPIIDRPI
jgi:hypothetical protein